MSERKQKCIVVGAGIAGLATAIRLANKGYDVEVFEANSYTGGKLTAIRNGEFRFDAGPSLFTMPHLVEELFQLSGKNTKDYFEYKKLDTICHYFYEDGTFIRAFADKEKFAEEIATKTQESKETVLQFLDKSAEKYALTADLFLFSSLHKVGTYLTQKTVKGVLGLPKLGVFKTMNQANEQTFKDKRVVQLFNRFATYNGSSPYQTPATLNIIPHLEHNIGAFIPKGGMHSISQSLYQLAQDIGVKFHLDSPVEKIIIENKKATGILSKGKTHRADLVVSNMDIVGTYKNLLKEIPAPQKLLNQPKSSSALIFYWGIHQQLPQLATHNIFFSKDYKTEFEYIFDKKDIYHDPTVYINMTSRHCPEDAPKGCDNWFVMINTPNNTGQNWDKLITEARQHIIKKLSRMLQLDVASLIVCEDILEPRTIESRTSSSLGALYGNSSNNRYAAFLRHANFSSKIKNLYFCGGSVHPGGGIPLCLSSAKIVSDLLS